MRCTTVKHIFVVMRLAVDGNRLTIRPLWLISDQELFARVNRSRHSPKGQPSFVADPVEPSTVAKVKAPLNGRVCGRACLGSYDPALVPEAPIGLIKKDSTNIRQY